MAPPEERNGLLSMAKIGKAEAQRLMTRDERVEGMLDEITILSSREQYAAEIRSLWDDAKKRFLSIGRYLNQAKETLAHGEFNAMIESDLPFTPATAYQMRAVAEAVDAGRLQVEELPGSYSIAYQVTTLSNDEIVEARQRGLLNAALKRADIISFKKTIRMPQLPPTARIDAKEVEVAALRKERDRMLARLREINDRFLELGRAGDVVMRLDEAGPTIEGSVVRVLEDAAD